MKNRNKKYFSKKSWNAFFKNRFKDKVDVQFIMKVGGRIRFVNKKKLYARGTESSVFTLKHLAHFLYMYQHNFSSCDGVYDLLKEYENVLKKEGNETAESVFNDYWLNDPRKKEDEFKQLERNKISQSIYESNELSEDEKKQAEWGVIGAIYQFETFNNEAKHAILYHIFREHENSNFDELKRDIELTPKFVKDYLEEIYTKTKE